MIEIGSSEFIYDTKGVGQEALIEYAKSLFDLWDSSVPSMLKIDDFSLSLEVETGSIKGKGFVLVAAGSVFAFVCGYGSFFQGLDTIRNHGNMISKFLAENSHFGITSNSNLSSVKYGSGAIGRLHTLFLRVKRNELSPDQATEIAASILGEDATANPELMEKLKTALFEVPVTGEQLPFEFPDSLPVSEGQDNQSNDRPKKDTKPKQAPIPSQLFRVQILKESKNGEKKIKVTRSTK